eukprot:TRINITY_DN13527_c0_g1_i2.p1 TRINITY_DN13527_c0_g1~~TRINITY_DN13527_c0_g1_i2.p1  ORF type:complete len:191 (+),score=27.90 TRINITY_DN13527_c0_g1_i2:453-1025(+)
MEVLSRNFENFGGNIVFRTEFMGASKCSSGYDVEVIQSPYGEKCLIKTESIVNAGGLWSDKVAHMTMKDDFPSDYSLRYCKGHYLKYKGQVSSLLRTPRLLYPAPEPGLKGLGIHLTVHINDNSIRFGPDALYIDSNLDYDFENSAILTKKFHNAIRRYLPTISEDQLFLDYTGIRPLTNTNIQYELLDL